VLPSVAVLKLRLGIEIAINDTSACLLIYYRSTVRCDVIDVIDCFNALPYVKKWLTRGHRAACDNQSRKSQPLKQECRYDHVRKIFD